MLHADVIQRIHRHFRLLATAKLAAGVRAGACLVVLSARHFVEGNVEVLKHFTRRTPAKNRCRHRRADRPARRSRFAMS